MIQDRAAVFAWRLSHDCEVEDSEYSHPAPATLTPKMEKVNAELRAIGNLSASSLTKLKAGGSGSDKRQARKKAKQELARQQQQKKPPADAPPATPDPTAEVGAKRPMVEKEPPVTEAEAEPELDLNA